MKSTTKKLIAILLSAVMIFSIASIVAFADDDVQAPADNKIYFNADGWTDYSIIYCHIWERGGNSFFAWQSKKEACIKEKGNLYSYDLSKLEMSAAVSGGLKAGKDYCVVFSSNTGLQTYDATFGTPCVGDKLSLVNGEKVENPVDSEKSIDKAVWDAQFEHYGPHFAITSIGNIIDGVLCPNEKATEVIGDWLPAYYNSIYVNPVEAVKKACDYLHLKTVTDYRDICSYIRAKKTGEDEYAMFKILREALGLADASPDEPLPIATPDEPAQDTSNWTVAGNAPFFGGDWNPQNMANKLTADKDGIYSKTYENAPAGTYEFKVTNGSWDESYGVGNENFKFYITETCDVTIRFDAEKKEVSVIGDNVKLGEPPEFDAPGYYITGSEGLCGSSGADVLMTIESGIHGSLIYKDFAGIAKGTYDFKIYYINSKFRKTWIANEKTYNVVVEQDNSAVRIILKPSLLDDTVEVELYVAAPGSELPALDNTEPTIQPTTAEPTAQPTTVQPATASTVKKLTPAKKANPMKVTAKSKTVKAKKLKKSKVTVSAITVKDAKGKLSYKKLSGSKKLSVTKKGKITVKKGTKKGTYKLKVKITAKGNSKYLAKSVTKTVRVKVK